MAETAVERKVGDVVWTLYENDIRRGVVQNVQNNWWVDVSWEGLIRNPYAERDNDLFNSWPEAHAELKRRAEADVARAEAELQRIEQMVEPA